MLFSEPTRCRVPRVPKEGGRSCCRATVKPRAAKPVGNMLDSLCPLHFTPSEPTNRSAPVSLVGSYRHYSAFWEFGHLESEQRHADAEPDAPPLARRDQREWLALALGASCAPHLLCDAQRRRPLFLHGSAAQGETPRRPTSRLRAKGGADCATPRRTDGGICGRDTCVACVAVSASCLACVIPARWHFSTEEFVAEERQGERREQGDFSSERTGRWVRSRSRRHGPGGRGGRAQDPVGAR